MWNSNSMANKSLANKPPETFDLLVTILHHNVLPHAKMLYGSARRGNMVYSDRLFHTSLNINSTKTFTYAWNNITSFHGNMYSIISLKPSKLKPCWFLLENKQNVWFNKSNKCASWIHWFPIKRLAGYNHQMTGDKHDKSTGNGVVYFSKSEL